MKVQTQATEPVKKSIGRAEKIALPELGIEGIPARIDTGAKTTALWASGVIVRNDRLHFALFDTSSPLFTGKVFSTRQFEKTIVASSNGQPQQRYKVKILIKLKGRKIRARVTLADRSQQVYPVLVGRNVLRGKFIVDVEKGRALHQQERERSHILQSTIPPEEQS